MGVKIDYAGMQKVRSFLIDYGNGIAKKIATEARDNLAEEYRESVALFYHQYTPKVYHRQYRLYDGFRKLYKSKQGSSGNVYMGGIALTSESLGDDYSMEASDVYGLAIHGFHGDHGIFTSPTIYDRMSTYAEILFNSIDYFV